MQAKNILRWLVATNLLLALLSFTHFSTVSTNIILTSQVPDDLMPCRPDTLFVFLSNNTTEPLDGIQINLQFDGIFNYVPGSVSSNAAEYNINDLNQPVFELQTVPPDHTEQIALVLNISCADYEAVFGTSHKYELWAYYANEPPINGITNTLVIDVPFLAINPDQISNNPFTGNVGEEFERTIPITNTSLGTLDSFAFRVEHDTSIIVNNVFPGTIINQDSAGYTLFLSGPEFQTIGNNNLGLDINETLLITENITIIDCEDAISTYYYEWGCGDELCQTESVGANVSIEEVESEVEFEVIEELDIGDCYCGDVPVHQKITFVNTGAQDVSEFLLRVSDPNSSFGSISGIDTSSIMVRYNGQVTGHNILNFNIISEDYLLECFNNTELCAVAQVGSHDLAIGDTLSIEWDVYFCHAENCTTYGKTGMTYRYYYLPFCPNEQQSSPYLTRLRENISTTISPSFYDIEDNEEVSFQYEIDFEYLNYDTGLLVLKIAFTDGLIWEEIDNLALHDENGMGETLPVSIDYQPPSSGSPQDSIAGSIQVQYELPVYTESTLNFHLIAECDELAANASANVTVDATIFLQDNCDQENPFCGIQACQSVAEVNIECSPHELEDSTCHCIYDYQLARDPSSWGWPDNDDDRIADGIGLPNPDLIRQDRAVTGDTLLETFQLFINPTENASDWVNGHIDITISSSLDSDSHLVTPSGLEHLSGHVKITDASEGTSYLCTIVPTISNFNNTLVFSYDISTLPLTSSCGLPSDFSYNVQDTIALTNKYVVRKGQYVDGNPEKIFASPSATFYSADHLDTLTNGCLQFSRALEITGFRITSCFNNTYYFPCVKKDRVFGYLNHRISKEDNFFPYEFRSFGRWEEYRINAPNLTNYIVTGFDFNSSILEVGYTSNISISTNVNYCTMGIEYINCTFTGDISPSIQGDYYVFDFNSYFADNFNLSDYPDENMILQLRAPNEITCPNTLSTEISTLATFGFNQNHPYQILEYSFNIIDQVEDSIYFLESTKSISNYGSLNLNFLDPVPLTIGYEEIVTWPFSIEIYSSPTPAAYDSLFIWLKQETLTGDFSNFILQFGDTSTALTPGILYKKKIHRDSLHHFILKANNHSCQFGEVLLEGGVSCDTILGNTPPDCPSTSIVFQVLPKHPTIVQEVISPGGNFDLCTPVSTSQVSIINSNYGTAYDVQLLVQLPVGLHVIPGSNALSYPHGAPFTSIPDGNLDMGFYNWELNTLNSDIAANGLPGALEFPWNTCVFQMDFITDCDFIAESYPIFNTHYYNNCEESNNSVYRPGEPIKIEGVVPPYESDISIEVEDIVNCIDAAAVTVNVVINSQIGANDRLFLTLPVGASYTANSVNITNGNISGEPAISIINERERLEWLMPPDSFTNIVFTIEVDSLSNLECGNEYFLVQTVALDIAFCEQSQEYCDTDVQTGDAFENIFVDNPQVQIESFILNNTQSSGNLETVNFSFDLVNTGDLPTVDNFFVIEYYFDSDANGYLSSEDFYLGLDSIPGIIPPDSSSDFSGNLTYPDSLKMCTIIAVLNQDHVCVCQSDMATASYPDQVVFLSDTTICSSGSWDMGKTFLDNAYYSWSLPGAPACDTCSHFTFSWTNYSAEVQTETVILSEILYGSCERTYLYQVNVLPYYDLIAPEQIPICDEDSLTITLPQPLDSILWWVNNNLFSSNTNEWSLAITDSSYTVTVEGYNELGCQIADSFSVINSSPAVFLNNDFTLCMGETYPLQIFDESTGQPIQQTNFSYNWSANPNLSCLDCPNPIFTAGSTATLSVVVLDSIGCPFETSVHIEVTDVEEPVIQANSLELCEGADFWLQATGNYPGTAPEYHWYTPTGSVITTIPQLEIASINFSNNGVYDLQIFHNDCFSELVSISLAVIPLPEPPELTSPTDFCVNDSMPPLTASGSNLIWYSDSTATVPLAQAPSPSTDAPGIFTYWVSQTVDECEGPLNTVEIAVHAIPDADAGPDGTITCSDPIIVLNATDTGGDVGYFWQTNDGNILDGATSSAATVDQNGEYLLQVFQLFNNACTDLDTVEVSLDTVAPTVVISPISATSLNCVDTVLSLTAEFSTPPSGTFAWFSPDGNIVGPANSPVITLDQAGQYQVIVTNPENGCTSEDSYLVSQTSYPAAFAGKDTAICNTSFTLSAHLPENMIGQWSSPNPSIQFDDIFDPQTTVRSLIMGTNQLVWTIGTTDCPELSSASVLVHLLGISPVANDDYYQLEGSGMETTLPVVQNDLPNDQFTGWTVEVVVPPGDGMVEVLESGDIFCRTALASNADMVFSYALCHAVCPDQCDTAVVRISLEFSCFDMKYVFAPNAITPNGDGINDEFYIDAIDVCPNFANASLSIVNRWGSEVFATQPYYNNWSGQNSSGNPLPEGTYYYLLRLDPANGIIVGGSVTILR